MPDDSPLFRFFNEVGIIAQLSASLFERRMPEGMTLAQFTVLNHFVRLGGERSPAALAEAFQVTRATMTSTLHRLETKGLVAVRPDERDGRAKRVSLTPAGAAMREECIARLSPTLAQLSDRIDAEAIVRLLPSLANIRAVLDADRSADGGAAGADKVTGERHTPHSRSGIS
jgi:DNA-binding MarR family transcriptional regulator